MSNDPRAIGADVRRFALEAEDAMRLDAFAARTGAVIEATIVPDGVRITHTTATGKTTTVTAETGPDAVRLLQRTVDAEVSNGAPESD